MIIPKIIQIITACVVAVGCRHATGFQFQLSSTTNHSNRLQTRLLSNRNFLPNRKSENDVAVDNRLVAYGLASRPISTLVLAIKNFHFVQPIKGQTAFERFTSMADWSLLFTTAIIASRFATNAITSVLAVLILYGLLFCREYIYIKAGFSNDFIPKEKQAIPNNWPRYALSTVGIICFHTFLSVQTSWASLGALSLKGVFTSWVHYVVGGLVWDVFAFQFIHRLMHRPEFYYLHNPHHVGTKNCNAFLAQSFHVVDLIPSFAFSTCSMILFGKGEVHLMTLLITMIAANNNHSCNPFSVIMFNPLLDKVFRVNISHQCHHARPNDDEHMGNLPIHHLITSLREKDIQKYNQIFKTGIN